MLEFFEEFLGVLTFLNFSAPLMCMNLKKLKQRQNYQKRQH